MNNKRLRWNCDQDLDTLAEYLRGGNVAIGSSDTVFGLFSIICQEGLNRLNVIKKRVDKPYIALFQSESFIFEFIDKNFLPENIRNIMRQCWPGPVTLILKTNKHIPVYMKGSNDTIAVRVPDHSGLQKLMQRVGPLFSTSANQSGEPIPLGFEQVNPEILQQVEYCINGEDAQQSLQASTILDCSGNKVKLIRKGSYSIEKLEKITGTLLINSEKNI